MMTLGDVNLQTIFIRSLDARAVELPYKGNKFSMIFILPEREDGFDEMDQRLRDVDLNNELSFGKGRTKFNVKIPKFKLESSHDLNEQLKSLGVKTAFVSGRSNFGGISKEPNQETFLKTVRQKAVIEVDEAGTEAVACTGVVAYAKCAPIQPCSFICNRPFIFLIRQQETGLILFIGRMMNPTQK
jgi:serpin B